MTLSFDKFFALTLSLAVGASVATGCAKEDSEDKTSTSGDETGGKAATGHEAGAAGVSGCRELSGAGSSCRIADTTLAWLAPANACRPDTIS